MADEIDQAQAVVEYCLNIQIANIRQMRHVAAPSLFECEQCVTSPHPLYLSANNAAMKFRQSGGRLSPVFLYVWNANGRRKYLPNIIRGDDGHSKDAIAFR